MSELFLAKEFYTDTYINKARRDYKGITDITIIDEGSYYRLIFQDCIYPEDITMCEFENYLIDLMAKK